MKILIAAHHFPPRYTGGAEWRACRTAAVLQARGHEVRVVCVERIDAGAAGEVTWEDETFEGVKVRRLAFNLGAAPDRFKWQYDNPWLGEHVKTLLAEMRPDLFHLFSGYLMTGSVLRAAHQMDLPSVVSLTDFWFLCPRLQMLRSNGQASTLPVRPARCARCLGEESRRYRLPGQLAPRLMDLFWQWRVHDVRKIASRSAFLRDTLNGVEAIISPSQFLRSLHVEAGINPARMVYSRQGHDFPKLTLADLEKTRTDSLRVGYLGQIAEIKGVHLLFQAVGQMPAAAVKVSAYGDPQPYPAYTRRLLRLAAGDSRLSLAGVYPRQEVGRVLRELDIIVVPSLWYENSPNVILEAFAHHVPVVASNLGGMAELVQEGKNGLLFRPGDAADLARQLRRLLEEPGLLATLQAGIGPVRAVADEMDELESIYRQVIQGGTARRAGLLAVPEARSRRS